MAGDFMRGGIRHRQLQREERVKTRRRRPSISPRARPRGKPALPTPGSQASSLQDCEKICFWCLSRPGCGALLCGPSKLICPPKGHFLFPKLMLILQTGPSEVKRGPNILIRPHTSNGGAHIGTMKINVSSSQPRARSPRACPLLPESCLSFLWAVLPLPRGRSVIPGMGTACERKRQAQPLRVRAL